MIAIVIHMIDFGNHMKSANKSGQWMFVATGMLENPKIEGCPQQRALGAVNSHR
ncbi:hypothetical protein [Variovorax sp. PAMC26660]|uniref:hypothetical protein n=1 Tax=Variovorax sp. PAMC26660 TaxID=2762322 RepID=UPI00164D38E4|nr:hypothetical protein [Variovorax sp. PAMC26660]QNK71827.1 hypothetical protein H7F35_26995 [Variovorax sp. PAMC26660]